MNPKSLPPHVAKFLGLLQGIRPTSNGWDACCPCPEHNRDGDQSPSLGIGLGEDQRILLTCRVGCSTDAVLDAMQLDWGDLFGQIEEEATVASPRKNLIVCPETALDHAFRYQAYDLLLDHLILTVEHQEDLRRRGLSDLEIEQRRYRSIHPSTRDQAATAVFGQLGEKLFQVPGFVQTASGASLTLNLNGLLIPVRNRDGNITSLKVRQAGKPKYLYLSGGSSGLSVASDLHVPKGTPQTADVIRLTEGELKADVAFVLSGLTTLGIPGVASWRKALPLLKEMNPKTVLVSYDSLDVRRKIPVFEQVEALFLELFNLGYRAELEIWND